MRIVFADTVYWIALCSPHDSLHQLALNAPIELGLHRVVTSELVLVETLNGFSTKGGHWRRNVTALVQHIVDNTDIDLVQQTPQLFHAAFALYCSRPDKSWSLTDCASFRIMEERQITEALTYDNISSNVAFALYCVRMGLA